MFRRLIQTKRDAQQVWRLPLLKHQKKLIIEEIIHRTFLKPLQAFKGVASVAGKKVFYSSSREFEFLFKEIFLSQSYFIQTDNQKPIIYDCGSNIGLSVLFFKLLYPNSKITAFEPQEVAFDCLSRMISSNKMSETFCHRKALASKAGEIRFYVDEKNPGSVSASMYHDRMPEKVVTVQADQLSNWIGGAVDILKIDIEGAELDVLQEMEGSGKLQHVKHMILEYHHHIESGSDHLSNFLRLLERQNFGYQIDARIDKPYPAYFFQDLTIFAYNKQWVR